MDSIEEVMEIATYSAKQSDLYSSKEVFDIFYNAMRGRQLITYNGLFKEYKALQKKNKLELKDIEELERIKEKAEYQLNYTWQKNLKEYGLYNEITIKDEIYFYTIEIKIE